MTDEELDEALASYEALEPPADFADRVVSAAPADEPAPTAPPRTRRRWLAWVAAGALAAAAATVALWPAPVEEGALDADARTSVALAGRGVAVAEAGASLRWRVEGASAEIEQSAGDVFYRAEPSERFRVQTPAGEVRVRGTCFRVEVLDMNVSPQLFVGAAAGAALAGAVLVTVYEGEVAVGNAHGELVLGPGERATLDPARAPRPADDDAEARDEAERAGRDAPGGPAVDEDALAAMDEDALRGRVRALSARDRERAQEIERLRGLLGDADLQADASEARFFPASPAELRQWAEACQLRVDMPPVMGMEAGRVGAHAETLGLSPEEVEVIQAAIDEAHASMAEDLRALYVEATGDARGAAHLSPQALFAELRDKAPRDEGPGLIMNRIARERAGLAPPPGPELEQSPTERAIRRYASAGDDFQARLAQALGPERAHALRAADGGWPWSHSIFSGCPDED